MSQTYLISKTSFLKGLHCIKAGYLYRYHPELKSPVPESRRILFNRGHKTGKLAWELYPEGIDARVSGRTNPEEDQKKTAELIKKNPAGVLFEPCFIYNRALVYSDILQYSEHGAVILEVKSSTRVTHSYILDAALQYYVITGCGLDIRDVRIVLIDTDYNHVGGSPKAVNLFKTVSIMKEVLEMQPRISKNVESQLHMLSKEDMPSVKVGEQCTRPYLCEYSGACNVHVSQPVLIKDNIKADIPALTKFIECIKYPVNILDFEVYAPAIPEYAGTKPFGSLPFQYSIIRQKSVDHMPEFSGFIAEHGSDPRRAFALALTNEYKGGSVIVYDATQERMILMELANLYEDLREKLMEIHANIIDLYLPFKSRMMILERAGDSVSLKKVYNSLTGLDPYHDLSIQDGFAAMCIYEGLHGNMDMFDTLNKREDLKKYCDTDVKCIFEILEIFRKIIH